MHQSVWRVSPFWRSDQFVSAVTATRGLASAWALWVDTDVRAPCRSGASHFDDAIKWAPLHLHGVPENGMPTMKKEKKTTSSYEWDFHLAWRAPSSHGTTLCLFGLTLSTMTTGASETMVRPARAWSLWPDRFPFVAMHCIHLLFCKLGGSQTCQYVRDLMTSINASHFCSVA